MYSYGTNRQGKSKGQPAEPRLPEKRLWKLCACVQVTRSVFLKLFKRSSDVSGSAFYVMERMQVPSTSITAVEAENGSRMLPPSSYSKAATSTGYLLTASYDTNLEKFCLNYVSWNYEYTVVKTAGSDLAILIQLNTIRQTRTASKFSSSVSKCNEKQRCKVIQPCQSCARHL